MVLIRPHCYSNPAIYFFSLGLALPPSHSLLTCHIHVISLSSPCHLQVILSSSFLWVFFPLPQHHPYFKGEKSFDSQCTQWCYIHYIFLKFCRYWKSQSRMIFWFAFSRLDATLQPALSVGWLVCRSLGRSHFTFFMILFFWPHCYCPNGLPTPSCSYCIRIDN